MERLSSIKRKTKETKIDVEVNIDGKGAGKISTGIPFFDHMLMLFSAHGFLDLLVDAKGDLEVDFHHTVEDVGLVLGDAFNKALGDRKGIKRYGYAVTPMDEALATVTVDLSNRPFLVYNTPSEICSESGFNIQLAKEFLRAFATRGGMNLHINVHYGENEHHIIEAVFKSLGRALNQASSFDDRVDNIRSTKGVL
jgi:imidazoleglycerol-phosphate dehydratase